MTLRLLAALAAVLLFSLPAGATEFETVGGVHAGGSTVWWWNLEMKAHVPAAARGRPGPVVVLLHGCGQQGVPFAQASGWQALSEQKGFALLVAEFKDYLAGAPGKDCPWWFDEEQRSVSAFNLTGRIRQAVMKAREDYAISGGENFITGLSAGAGMALVTLATYPDDFAAGATVAGLPVGCAQIAINKGGSLFMTPELRRAFGCMDGPAGVAPEDWAREAARLTLRRASWPRLSIWQGDADQTVKCVNAVEIAQQWAGLNGLALPAATTCEDMGRNPPPHDPVWTASRRNETVVEMRLLAGFDHAMPIDPASGCGIETERNKPAGVCAAAEIVRFFGIE